MGRLNPPGPGDAFRICPGPGLCILIGPAPGPGLFIRIGPCPGPGDAILIGP